jgi:hypothetical protein
MTASSSPRDFSPLPGWFPSFWRRTKIAGRANLCLELAESLHIGRRSQWSHEKVAALGVKLAEDLNGGAVKGIAVPFAFDGVHFVAAMGQDKIHFMALLVAPIAHRRAKHTAGTADPLRKSSIFPESAFLDFI